MSMDAHASIVAPFGKQECRRWPHQIAYELRMIVVIWLAEIMLFVTPSCGDGIEVMRHIHSLMRAIIDAAKARAITGSQGPLDSGTPQAE